MTLIIFYSVAIFMGFALMCLFYKYFENRKIYYIAWAFTLLILFLIAPIMNESVFYVFKSENYENIPVWLSIVFFIFILVPTSFLLYPLMRLYRWIFGSFEELFLSIMLLFISKNRKITYYNLDGSQTKEGDLSKDIKHLKTYDLY